SIGGIIIELLDRFPTEGESVETNDGIILTATSVDNNRIETVTVQLPATVEENDENESNSDEKEIE
ncbi:MAG: hemolysin, partial [Lachnospiraceae bacterium]|nr:hemolysin [Lachnospiraceae bacterium]